MKTLSDVFFSNLKKCNTMNINRKIQILYGINYYNIKNKILNTIKSCGTHVKDYNSLTRLHHAYNWGVDVIENLIISLESYYRRKLRLSRSELGYLYQKLRTLSDNIFSLYEDTRDGIYTTLKEKEKREYGH